MHTLPEEQQIQRLVIGRSLTSDTTSDTASEPTSDATSEPTTGASR